MKKYNILYDTICELYNNSPEKYKEKYYRRVLSNSLGWANKTDVSRADMIRLIVDALGRECRYCGRTITAKNENNKFSLDHTIPQYRGGSQDIENLEIICSRCNTRKGYMTATEYELLLQFLEKTLDKEARGYVLKKLAMWVQY